MRIVLSILVFIMPFAPCAAISHDIEPLYEIYECFEHLGLWRDFNEWYEWFWSTYKEDFDCSNDTYEIHDAFYMHDGIEELSLFDDEILDEVVVNGNWPSYWNIIQVEDGKVEHNEGSGVSEDTEEHRGGGGGNSVPNHDTQYDDREDKVPNYYSLEYVLEWAKKRSKSIKIIIEDIQKQDKIIEDANDSICHYNPEDHCIHVPLTGKYSVESIIHEVIHYLQDTKGMLDYDRCSADNEYQAYVLNYILNLAYDKNEKVSEPYGAKELKEWQDFIETIPEEIKYKKGKFIYTDNFINNLNCLDHKTLSLSFREYYKKLGKENYYKYHDPDYKYNWEQILEELGFEKE